MTGTTLSTIMSNTGAAGELVHHQFICLSVAAVDVTPPHVVVMVTAHKLLQPSPAD